MMPGYGGMAGWGWMFMSLGTLVFLLLIGLVAWLVLRAGSDGRQPGAPRGTAREILAERFARGEIDDQEYQNRLRTLGG